MSARLAPYILSLNEEYTLHFLNFLIFGLCNSLAKCCFDIILLLIVLTLVLSACVTDVLTSLDFLAKN